MGLPVLLFDAKRLEAVELVPFKAGIEAGAKAVMTAHLALPKLDAENRPATLSHPIMTGLLRKNLGFHGIIVTDGMTMQGVTDKFSPEEAAVLAIEAGADVVLVPENFQRAYRGILEAVKSGKIAPVRLDESVRRILSAKAWLGLDKSRFVDVEKISDVVGDSESAALAQEISDKSVTLLRNNANRLPVRPNSRIHLLVVTDDVNMQAGTELHAKLQSGKQQVMVSRLWDESSKEQIEQVRRKSNENDINIVAVYLSIGSWKGKLGVAEPLAKFIGEIGQWSKPSVLVAFGDPYVLGKMPSMDIVLACYNGTILAERSVGNALLGLNPMKGKLPVTIPGKYARGEGLEFSAISQRKGE